MRISKASMIAGVPALEARQLMRDMRQIADISGHIDPHLLTDDQRAVLDRFVQEGYLEVVEPTAGSASDKPTYRPTIAGGALALATAAKPVKRATAERALADLIDRTREMNADPDMLMWVDRIVVFGSYLNSEVAELGDVDCGVWLSRRYSDGKEYVAKSIARADASGRTLSYIERLNFGEREAKLRLKGRSRVISLHEEDHDIVATSSPYAVVYEREGATD